MIGEARAEGGRRFQREGPITATVGSSSDEQFYSVKYFEIFIYFIKMSTKAYFSMQLNHNLCSCKMCSCCIVNFPIAKICAVVYPA